MMLLAGSSLGVTLTIFSSKFHSLMVYNSFRHLYSNRGLIVSSSGFNTNSKHYDWVNDYVCRIRPNFRGAQFFELFASRTYRYFSSRDQAPSKSALDATRLMFLRTSFLRMNWQGSRNSMLSHYEIKAGAQPHLFSWYSWMITAVGACEQCTW